MLFIGPAAELVFGRQHFMNMTAVFTGAPEFTVLLGRTELGRIDPSLLVEEVTGDRRVLLGGRSWRVTYIDWRRRRCFVEPADGGGRARWTTLGWAGLSYEISQAMREVLLGADPPVRLTRRAQAKLDEERTGSMDLVHPGGSLIRRHEDEDVRWWTWAGFRTNATLAATLSEVTHPVHRFNDQQIRLREDLTPEMWRAASRDAGTRLCLPDVSEKALVGLKFSDALPKRLAMATMASRIADLDNASRVLAGPVRLALA
jgi:ATP-dependent Lhr-like helicase